MEHNQNLGMFIPVTFNDNPPSPKMDIAVHLKNTVTGERCVYRSLADSPFCDYIWSEGNYACDCNRSLFMAQCGVGKKLECNSGDNVIVIDGIYDGYGALLYKDAR